ncbi:hypothetical protein COY88_01055 [Candidatus Roizmanbacteria bacterium CG_4_10_14_0_8_um_filter_35_28]|uniref:Uncharacterized protein n=3 Tax=Candidatus Roizmaniibacteriota TaxID=1752723 RepID=A0A2M8F331_9BACT|nr:glucosaminidase domain-containing protein [Candidatus Roizmanbacteria bacterium]PIP14981.1 MAG: hypothetical protein COX47_02125 [Candidatus Roizmanbacteria bacterium CG23_combo_of_CG06-09_8_20_14_all_35_49]PIY71315.1 MAG: hypothetical protein COY88_01055 [Candidatus Roizmanbacteria bacterium CG_4_10_14_0_8_um_filter_35_28]PJC33696.1 MAG: hypothetical protein CO048_02505 [Candidatus Roizmanbacteria bacterium CG_4_9_14_0_2_um_filter_35_15]
MNKLIITIVLIGLFLFLVPPVLAENISGQSASLTYKTENSITNYKKKLAIEAVLKKYRSPLVNQVDSFLQTCEKYQLDCYLLPAIAGLESTFGRFIWPNSYNPFGWGRGYLMFESWPESINAVAKGLRDNYVKKGAVDVYAIGPIYSESPTWAARVTRFINEFEKEETKLTLLSSEFPVEL